MALVYLDTSALVKLFIIENGTDLVTDLVRKENGHAVAVLELARVELHAAIHRRERVGDVKAGTASEAREMLEYGLRTQYEQVEVDSTVLNRACTLIDRHHLRAYDAMQLSGAIAHFTRRRENGLFVTADKSLFDAATEEGVQALNPSSPSTNT